MKVITIKDNQEYLRKIYLSADITNDKQLETDINILNEYCNNHKGLAMTVIQLGIPKRNFSIFR